MNGLTKPAGGSSLIPHLAIVDPALESRLGHALQASGERLRVLTDGAPDPYVAELVGYLIATGGKLFRPLLALLGAEFGDPDAAGVVDAAVIVELVHVASLYHDDVMDQALTRRGVRSANSRWGNSTAVVAGNWLLAKAAQLAAELGPSIVQLHSDAAERLVLGQIYELSGPCAGGDPLSHYFEVIAGKSAALISASLQIGAVQAGAPRSTAKVLADFGEHLGIAFQISDDLLDITSDQLLTGKEQGKDLSLGVASLPVLLALRDERPKARRLRELLVSGRTVTPTGRRQALALFRRSRAVTDARTILNQHLDQARDALGSLPPSAALRVLDSLCDVVAHRVR